MKKTYHLCLSAGNEIMFRDLEDYNKGFNYFAIALHMTGSTGLVESFMSNHFHLMIQSENPKEFMYAMRKRYSRHFNSKYDRSGIVGEKHHFQLEVSGLHHHLAAMSYTLRNPLHHGVAPIPYAYPHSSANVIFQKEMGKVSTERLLPHKSFYKHIGRRTECPATYRMSESGVFLRESVLDIVQVENMYATPRSFNYYMGRKTCEEWLREQSKDKENSSPIRLEDIENGINMQSYDKMLTFESGRADYKKISDIELCKVIDHEVLPSFGKVSVYHLTESEKVQIANMLFREYRASEAQIRRCLVMNKL